MCTPTCMINLGSWTCTPVSKGYRYHIRALKTASDHDANSDVTGGTEGHLSGDIRCHTWRQSCRCDNLRCLHRRQSWHYSNLEFSVLADLYFYVATLIVTHCLSTRAIARAQYTYIDFFNRIPFRVLQESESHTATDLSFFIRIDFVRKCHIWAILNNKKHIHHWCRLSCLLTLKRPVPYIYGTYQCG